MRRNDWIARRRRRRWCGSGRQRRWILDDISVVTAPYTLDNKVVGVLGIIGPTRMAYERVIPIVDVTAKLLGSALNARK